MAQPMTVYQIKNTDSPDPLYLVFRTETPPLCFRKYHDSKTHHKGDLHWGQSSDTWFRAADIVGSQEQAKTTVTSLKKGNNTVINLGRWLTYHLIIDKAKSENKSVDNIISALKDWNIPV